MYVGYMLDKEGTMYPTPVRRPNLNVSSAQSFAPGPQYSDYSGYHVPAMDPHPQQANPMAWNPAYGAPPREDWAAAYGLGPPNPVQVSHSPGQLSYGNPDYGSLNPPVQGLLPALDTHPNPNPNPNPTNHSNNDNNNTPPATALTLTLTPSATPSLAPSHSPNGQRRNPYEWMKKSSQISAAGKTRTKDKYRVVYTDHQRLELEKEFHYNRYITIKRKSELATILGLSERQVKIWFQNRRAKERKITKKQMAQSEGCPSQHGPVSASAGDIAAQMMVGNQMSAGQSIGNMPQVTVAL